MSKKKPLIIAIVGESGTGKSRAVKYISEVYGINLIQSYTERAKRQSEIDIENNGGKADHKFLTKEQFDALKKEDMIAYTNFGDYRYCCLKKDVADINLYIIDEFGLDILNSKYSEVYDIVSVRLTCDDATREKRCGDMGRFYRDENRFVKSIFDFTYNMNTTYRPYVCERDIHSIVGQILANREYGVLDNITRY